MTELIHTLLFMIRKDSYEHDIGMVEACLKSLEKSTYKTVVVMNQGFWSNDRLEAYLQTFQLDCIIIGDGNNIGIVAGRQQCFTYVWENMPETRYVSELHLDMIFTHKWEDPLVEYLLSHDEPLVCCGIVNKKGELVCLNQRIIEPEKVKVCMDVYLQVLLRDEIVHGFTHPCIHRLDILKAVGGYDTNFLTGNQAFEDDSLLVGYHYYYGTRANWRPKVNYNSVVYHEIAGQRNELKDNEMINFYGLKKQYGAMGLLRLSLMHVGQGHIAFFARQSQRMQRE